MKSMIEVDATNTDSNSASILDASEAIISIFQSAFATRMDQETVHRALEVLTKIGYGPPINVNISDSSFHNTESVMQKDHPDQAVDTELPGDEVNDEAFEALRENAYGDDLKDIEDDDN